MIGLGRIQRICNFSVSELHLVTTLIPYLGKNYNKNIFSVTILERNLQDDVNLVLNSLNLTEEEKKKISSINWNKNTLIDTASMSEYLHSVAKKHSEINIVLSGNASYIQNFTDVINKIIREGSIFKNKNINIINCYNLSSLSDNVKFVLKDNQKILNASGIKDIDETMSEYKARFA